MTLHSHLPYKLPLAWRMGILRRLVNGTDCLTLLMILQMFWEHRPIMIRSTCKIWNSYIDSCNLGLVIDPRKNSSTSLMNDTTQELACVTLAAPVAMGWRPLGFY